MTIFLEPLIDRVRLGLAAVPQNMIDDPQIYQALKDSQKFLDQIKDTTRITEDYEKTCLTMLAVYYAYVGYSSLATRDLGNVPEAAVLLVDTYRSIALAFLQPISVFPLNPDLTINTASMTTMRGLAFAMSQSFIEDD